MAAFVVPAATESLWVDELHSSWVISGSFGEIDARARAGNQSPTYFWLLWGLAQTLGQSETVLRLPSMISAIICTLICAAICCRDHTRPSAPEDRSKSSYLAFFMVLGWVCLDRIQLFYATEARVYGLLQLVTLLGWCAALRVVVDVTDAKRVGTLETPVRSIWTWAVLAVLAIHLHILAALAIAWQWFFVMVVLFVNRRIGATKYWIAASVAVFFFSLPAFYLASAVWGRREQWEIFAGDASLANAVRLFPVLPLLVPVVVARCLDWGVSRFRDRTERVVRDVRRLEQIGWLVAAAGPWITVWGVTAFEIAPLMHRRYVLCAALPLVLFAAYELLRTKRASLRWGALVCSVGWLLASQGTIDVWSRGQWVGWLRAEGWRIAARHVSEQFQSGDELWCASGLIESNQAELPLDQEFLEYLTFPLRGIYRVRDADGEPVQPLPLWGKAELWGQQWQSGLQQRRSLFVIYRGRATNLNRQLDDIKQLTVKSGIVIRTRLPIKELGRVCVVRLEVERHN